MSNLLTAPPVTIPAKSLLARDGGLRKAAPGMEMVDLKRLGFVMPIAGGDRGYHARGDVLTQTQDGTDLNALWRDYQDMLNSYNAKRNVLIDFLTWNTTSSYEELTGAAGLVDFEEASEYGEPVGVRLTPPPTSLLGYTFKWYDLAARFTWQFLADAMTQQVDQLANAAAEADNRLRFNMVMKTIFNNVRRVNREGQTVYPFYSGQAGDLPPAVGTTTFADSHQHYVTSGGATVTPQNLEALQTLLREHGYKRSAGYTLVLMINEAQENTIRQFRSQANGAGLAAGIVGNYDFIPAQGTSPLLLPTDVQVMDNGVTRPPATLRGLDVVGGYGEMVIVKSEYIPAGYMFAFATGGTANIQNPVAVREHPNAGLRGLRLVKGRTPDYPLIDSFYNRGFGTGVRYRGAGAVMQITTNASYTVPATYAGF